MTSDPVEPVHEHDQEQAGPEDGVRSAALVVLLAPVLAAVVAVGDWCRLTPWAMAGVCCLALMGGAWWMRLEHVAFVAVVGWCLITGFSQNTEATLTATRADLSRLALLVGPAALVCGWSGWCRRHRVGRGPGQLRVRRRRSWAR